METEQPNLHNPNTLSRIFVVARALKDVLHENRIATIGRLNEGMGFDVSREQERILANGPVTLSQSIERHQSPELS